MSLNKSEEDRKKTFSRRAVVVGAVQGGLLCLLGARLGWLQLVQGPRYKTLSDKNRIDVKMITPSRGRIMDRNGKDLAINQQNFRVLIVPEQAEDPQAALEHLKTFIELSDDDIQSVLENIKRVSKFVSVEVKDQLEWEDVAKVEVNLPDLPGLSVDVGEARLYPYKHASAHIVGYVGAPNKAEAKQDQVFSLPGFKIGKTGIEKHYDQILMGKTGLSEVEVNVTGREVRELARHDSQPGKDITLSIDADLQDYVQNRLSQERSSTAIIMDAQTGAVYALVSHPSFDPNLFIKGMSAETWEDLLSTPGYPLTNKAISGQYPPASTFKMITALAALKDGVTNSKRTVHCPGHYTYGGQKFHCWKVAGHGHMNLVDALAESCDTYFYQLATEVGIEKIAQTARSFGLGDKLGFELKEERPGLVPDKNWKMGYFGQSWKAGETIVASIGQGYLQATPLQMAVMTARLVNGGLAVKPWIVQTIGDKPHNQHKWPKMQIDPWHLELIQKGTDAVVNGHNGTAKKSRIDDARYAMGGKTGTAQVKRISPAQRAAGVKNEDLPWEQRHHALFTGYAPLTNPRYVCCVVVEHGVGGSLAAAPIARDIMLKAQHINPARI